GIGHARSWRETEHLSGQIAEHQRAARCCSKLEKSSARDRGHRVSTPLGVRVAGSKLTGLGTEIVGWERAGRVMRVGPAGGYEPACGRRDPRQIGRASGRERV